MEFFFQFIEILGHEGVYLLMTNLIILSNFSKLINSESQFCEQMRPIAKPSAKMCFFSYKNITTFGCQIKIPHTYVTTLFYPIQLLYYYVLEKKEKKLYFVTKIDLTYCEKRLF